MIKYNRVHKLSRWSAYQRTFAAIIAQIPDHLWASLTARQIVALIECMQSAHCMGKDVQYTEDTRYMTTA